MAIALVASASGVSVDGGASATTSSINTTSADRLMVLVSYYSPSAPTLTVTDSKSNTWTALTASETSVSAAGRWYYSASTPTVGSGHTFTVSDPSHPGLLMYPSIYAIAFSGVNAYNQESGANTGAGSATTQAPGSLTPPSNGALFVAGLSYAQTSTVSVNSSFTLETQQPNAGSSVGGAIAYYIQPTAAAKNPSFSWTGAIDAAAVMATFTATGGGVGGSTKPSHYYRQMRQQ